MVCSITKTSIFLDNIRAEKSGKRKFQVEIRGYFKSLISYFYISVLSVTKQCSKMFTKFDEWGTNICEFNDLRINSKIRIDNFLQTSPTIPLTQILIALPYIGTLAPLILL